MRTKKKREIVEATIFEAEKGKCHHCGKNLRIVQNRKRWVETFEGKKYIIAKDRGCLNKECPYYLMYYRRPIEETKIALNNQEYGFDIITQEI